MRTRAAVLIVDEKARQVLLISSVTGDHKYTVIPGGSVAANQDARTVVVERVQTELGLDIAQDAIDWLGEFDYQGNPQICFVTSYAKTTPRLTPGTCAQAAHWVSFNELEHTLDYLPAVVDAFFQSIVVLP
ncbi:NUDIX hydrolase [Periweissella fabaria]|uniref:Nudix hydrolase domain-containing protein n=1 Tax=Periweissella fabaria TaxID=546157 RepID=A0ABM8Z5V3_9LACO|nr:NUDIX hydrolase [Periweissella fabaria]MCM0597295.1 NUDIX hydrolase [Periweissella fabaria]CAH0416200.1 hypothetical protein WFA24289_00499 [Periweissella fabaria]